MQHNKKRLLISALCFAQSAFAAEPTLAELKAELQALTAKVAQLEKAQSSHSVVHTSTVGLRSAIDGSDLLTNLPSMNEDVRLLEQRTKDTTNMASMHPSIQLSGNVSAQSYWQHIEGQDKTHADLGGFGFTLFSLINPWVQAIGTINFDNNPFNDDTGIRISNSRLYLKRAFITLGQLNQSPIYASFGQMYVPFGRYSSSALTSPLTAKIARTAARGMSAGYVAQGAHQTLVLNGFVGVGDGSTAKASDQINEGALNVSWRMDQGLALGASWLYNLAASAGLVHALDTHHHQVDANVHAMDVYAKASVGPWYAHSEYVSALSAFKGEQGVTLEVEDQRPRAMHIELGYHGKDTQHPWTVSVDYGRSWSAMHIVPRQSMGLAFSRVLWRATQASFEYRHNHAYAGVSSGASNRLLGQISVYF